MGNPIRIQHDLTGVDHPARRDDLVRKAEGNGADEQVLELLRNLPDRTYEGPSGVSKEIAQKS